MTPVEHGYETSSRFADRALIQVLIPHLVGLTGPRPRIVVAFSGGIDSTVLAHALMRGRRKLSSLRLVHVDHGLQAASAEWSRQCARQARSWRVPFTSVLAKVKIERGDSPEAAARAARYAALEAALEPGEVLVTGQHREDQVETLLLQLFRGAGVAGLAAMPEIAPFGAGRLARPLLEASRASLVDYATRNKLRWIEDPTNAENRFARNYLRHTVLPAIRTRWVGVDMAIARSARNMADAQALLSAIAAADLARLADGAGLSVAGLKALPRPRRLNALREFIRRSGARVPSSATTMEIAGNLIAVRADALPEVHWPGCVMRRRAGRLELEVQSEIPVETYQENLLKSWCWEREREYIVNGVGDRLALLDDPHGPIDLDLLPTPLEIRARVGGEKLRPGPRARTQALKKLIQSAKLSAEGRARLPLLFAGDDSGDRLIAAGDRWIDASVMANDKSRRRARLRWTRK
jgi:tRNA(Ile)-lysidine synthase